MTAIDGNFESVIVDITYTLGNGAYNLQYPYMFPIDYQSYILETSTAKDIVNSMDQTGGDYTDSALPIPGFDLPFAHMMSNPNKKLDSKGKGMSGGAYYGQGKKGKIMDFGKPTGAFVPGIPMHKKHTQTYPGNKHHIAHDPAHMFHSRLAF